MEEFCCRGHPFPRGIFDFCRHRDPLIAVGHGVGVEVFGNDRLVTVRCAVFPYVTRAEIRGYHFQIPGAGGASRCRAQLPVPGLHMVQNALLAVAAGRVFGLSLEECAAGLVAAPLTKARLQVKEIRGVQFLDDSYNANPDSMKAALRTLVELDAEGQRIAVLGEMRELGGESEAGHREVGEMAAALKVDHLIAIGNVAAGLADAAKQAGLENSSTVASTAEAAELLAVIAAPGDLVLIKGSRLARTEQVIEAFRNLSAFAKATADKHSAAANSP